MSANFDGIGRGPAAVNLHVLADGPTRLLQALQKCPDASLKFRIVCCCGQEHADAPYRLLRARRDRPRCRSAEQRDELAPSSLDHLVGAGEQRWWNVEAERFGGLEVYGELKLGRLLHG